MDKKGLFCRITGLFLGFTLCFSSFYPVLAQEDNPLTPEQLALMQEQSVYTVGYSQATIPISYTLRGALTGVSIEMMEDFAQTLGVEFDFIDLDDPKNQAIPLDMNLKMENFSTLTLSDPFLTIPALLVERSRDSEPVSTIGIQEFFGLIDAYEVMEGKNIESYPNLSSAMKALDRDEVDGVIISSLGYSSIIKDVDKNIYTATLLEEILEYNIYFSQGFPQEKIDIFNLLIADYGNTRMDYLMLKHSNYNITTMTVIDVLQQNMYLILFSLGGLIFISLLLKLSQRQRFKRLVEYDEMTGLLTQRKFMGEMEKRLKGGKETFAVLSLDIDNFKYVNEIFDFQKGSELLEELANTMVEIWPDPEILMSRSHGDNFLLLLNQDLMKDLEEDKQGILDKISRKMSALLGTDYRIHFSLGIYPITQKDLRVSLMIDNATFARNKGKDKVGNSVYFYDEAMEKERVVNNRVSSTMHEALTKEEFVLYYQPKFDLQKKKTIGAEALVRWVREGTLIPPNDFIPIFERNGFIEKLDYYVLTQVCRYIRKQDNPNLPVISVNLSGMTLQQPNVVGQIIQILKEEEVTPAQIDLEVTESAFVDMGEEFTEKLDRFRQLGFTISMDDFGAGISSLNRLKEIPLDILKIDRAFIVGSLENEKGGAIIENVIRMAKQIGLETVAEGIETQEQLDYLRDQGCCVGQGYFYSRPLPEADFTAFYQTPL